jgi:hypothetical protein
MRTMLSLLSPLTTAAFCAAAALPAAAQRATAPDYVRPVVQNAAGIVHAALPRTVAVFRFAASQNTDMPAQVTVADSAGELVATYRLAGARGAGPMTVDVLNTDLVLQGETPSGALTLVLYRQNDPEVAAARAIVGRWSLGDHQGELRGRAAR